MVKPRITAAQTARIALMGALLFGAQVALSALPNIEVVTLLIVIFTKNLGKEGIAAAFVYVWLTALLWGFGIWWGTYLVVWTLFAVLVYLLRKIDSWLIWALINGTFGLCFGAIFAIPYLFVSPAYALSWWMSGIPFDVTHCFGNLAAALILGKPLDAGMERVVKMMKITP